MAQVERTYHYLVPWTICHECVQPRLPHIYGQLSSGFEWMLIKTLERKRLALWDEMHTHVLEFLDYYGLTISCRARKLRMSYQVCDLTVVIRWIDRHSSRVLGCCQMTLFVESSHLLLAAFQGSRALDANHSENFFHLMAPGTREIDNREGTQLRFVFSQHLRWICFDL